VDFDGVIITKLDGDARGGAALSVRAVTGKPIKFVGVGEKLEALEPFYPDRMAQRILGMGDVVSLIERAQETVNAEDAAALEERMRANEFTLDDFLSQLQQVRKMGSLKDMLGMIPGMGAAQRAQLADAQIDEKALDHTQAIIQSMSAKERRKPALINGHRRVRIAAGSGTSVQEVNRLLEQFTQAKKMMKQMTSGKGGGRGKGRMPF
jgi:signal recognition particle subunit SRP54